VKSWLSAEISENFCRSVVDFTRVSLKELGWDEFIPWGVANRMDLIRSESLVCDEATVRMPGKVFAGGKFSFNLRAVNMQSTYLCYGSGMQETLIGKIVNSINIMVTVDPVDSIAPRNQPGEQ